MRRYRLPHGTATLYDPDAYGAPVIYGYRTVHDKHAPGGAKFISELIHNRSGAGSEITAVDINKDGAIDFITATNRGHIYLLE